MALLIAGSTVATGERLRQLQSSAPNSGNIDLWSCPPNEASAFTIQLINMGDSDDTTDDLDQDLASAFELAAKRWQKVIVGDVTPSFPANQVTDWFDGQFDQPFNGAVNDLVIGFSITDIDGRGGTLGSAGPTFLRSNGRGAPIAGVMRFDRVDARQMPLGDFKAIVLHEMGHVLGLVGTTTNRCSAACNPNSGQQSGYSCPFANAEYEQLVSDFSNTDPLKLENNGGAGTACGHWEENSFRTSASSELMTGFFEANLLQPISLVTVAALDDLGFYDVDYCGADVWPATPETQQKFEVFLTEQDMDAEGMMERLPPGWTFDDEGNLIPTEGGGSSSAFSVGTGYQKLICSIILGFLARQLVQV